MRFLVILLLLLTTLQAEHVRWFGDFDKAHKQALKESKNLLVLLIESKKNQDILMSSFMNQDYIKEINTNFVPVLIIKDQQSSYPIEMLYTLVYPSLFVLNKEELFVCKPLRADITPSRLEAYLSRCTK